MSYRAAVAVNGAGRAWSPAEQHNVERVALEQERARVLPRTPFASREEYVAKASHIASCETLSCRGSWARGKTGLTEELPLAIDARWALENPRAQLAQNAVTPAHFAASAWVARGNSLDWSEADDLEGERWHHLQELHDRRVEYRADELTDGSTATSEAG
eukprot:scaffold26783_cov47-Phaeocystis_antarctica.AAC.2